MNLKEVKAPVTTITVDRIELENKSGKNIYETIVILEKISQKINSEIKEDLDKKLEEFNLINKNNLEEVFENKEQIDLSKFYERLPKATSISIQYLLDGKIKIH
ncbi:MAG: hypothetical protein LBQ72_00935 [Flavobacteriales bacterium]|jgi:hypothetical protein|uniref:hypothetical protein n=1 Tax=Blattabacterium sp. (Mastotermes darwiniensis) TaxID=39768 RepID=UPI000231DE89|nr:hypothetical protein [Blattabacterium sp. (Mastotermes darwiniensis)]AER40701.1 hypothetical protein MADAR_401 [Blattabacterium sp. (Mastotermes darwiniensis) str. MADAR]MDR1804771.1 hypothetical protein [Flavobacteriales bacterium]